jgi:beta-lactamase regulating signal transducer with metallopeptidase domain
MEPITIIPALIQAAIGIAPGLMTGAADTLSAAFRAASEQAAPITVSALWQSAVVAKDRFYIWAAAFATLAGLPLLGLVSGSGSTVAAGLSSAGQEAAARPWLSLDARWSLAIAALWAVGTLLRAGDLAVHSFRLRKLWKEAIPVDADGSLNSGLTFIEYRGPVQVCTTTELQRPSVIGFLKPRILIPDWLFARLTAGELEQIVLHESEHLRRRDDWTNLVQKLCLVVFPLNPALAWIERRLCREREMACDDGVIRITRAPRAYAACLASLAERGLERRAEALSLGAWQRRPELVHRVHSILRGKHTLGPVGTRVLLSALGCGLLFGAIELARCPQVIAFVPARDLDRNVYAANSGAPVPSQVGAWLADGAFVPVRSEGVGQDGSGIRAVNLKAVMSASGPATSGDAEPLLRRSGERADGSSVRKTANDAGSPRAVYLKAELDGARPAQPVEQQWIVFTTWEQVQMPSENAALTADYEAGANAGAAGDSNAESQTVVQSNSQPASRITITRLILRVSSFPTRPAYIPLHGGWFVIQL